MHSSASITSMRSASWMQSTGQTLWQEMSLMSMQASPMMYVIVSSGSYGRESGSGPSEPEDELELVGQDRHAVFSRSDGAHREAFDRTPGERRERLVEACGGVDELAAGGKLAVEREG